MKISKKQLKQIIKEEVVKIVEAFEGRQIADCVAPKQGSNLCSNKVVKSSDGFEFLSRRSEGYHQKAERFKANTSQGGQSGPPKAMATVRISEFKPGYFSPLPLGRLMSVGSVTIDGVTKYKVTLDNRKNYLLDYLMISDKHTDPEMRFREKERSKREKERSKISPPTN